MDLLWNKEIEVSYDDNYIKKDWLDFDLIFDIINKIDLGISFNINYNMDVL